MTLYELTGAMRDFELEVNEDGEITNADELDNIEMAWNDKCENLCLYIKNLKAELTAVKEEEKTFKQRAKVLSNKIDKLTDYLKTNLKGEKFRTSKVSVTYRKSDVVVCESPQLLDPRFQKVKIEVDKTGIKQAIKSGEKVTGAHLEENVSVILK